MTTKLVCAVGTGRYEETTYHFGDAEKTTNLAPIAVGYCVVERKEGLELVTLLTDEAEAKYGERLKTEAEDEGWAYTKVGIPAGRSEEELWEIFDAFGQELEQGDKIVLDLTHGFRHIPALLLSATQYYAVRKDLNLLGIFYAAYEAKDNNRSPIFDLTPLYDLSEWTYGVRLLRDYQFPAALGEMLDEIQRRSHTNPRYGRHRFRKLQKLGRSLKNLEAPLVSGIPLESGFEAHEALQNARDAENELKDELKDVPPMKELWRELEEQLESFGLQKPSVPKKEKPKRKVSLTMGELERQSRLIGGHLESENLWAAANLLREWMISAVIFHSGSTENWLDYGEGRKPVESKLGALSQWNEKEYENLRKALTAEQRKLIGLWDGISERRNTLAHAGMREDMTKFQPEEFRQAFKELRDRLGENAFWNLEISDKTEEVWLISPLGTTPGALFTAIKKAKPDRLLIVTSKQGEGLASDVLHAAGREDLNPPHFCILDDPFNGFSEVRDKRLTQGLRREHGLDWIQAQDIVVNLTGGTTCLGWTVGQLRNSLREMSLNPRTVACIDRRSPEEQRQDPYQEGKMQDVEPMEEREDE